MDIEGIPDQDIDYLLEDLGEVAVTLEVAEQQKANEARIARNPSRASVLNVNPYTRRGTLFNNPDLLKNSFGVKVWSEPDAEGRSAYVVT